MSIASFRIIDRVYPLPLRRILQAVMVIAVLVYAAELTLIYCMPALGLRLLWFATIPLAPMILLIAPNAWVSVCPISTFQTISHRFGRNPARRLSARATERLQLVGWIMMLVGIPTRHLLFNTVGWATFWMALIITGLVIVAGLSYRSLSSWCVGACPIRPIEVLYGQFALDKHRPEKCTNCSACIKSCLRLVPERSHGEFHRSPWTGHLSMGFPGFVAAYFLLDLMHLCNMEHAFFAGATPSMANWLARVGTVYGLMAAGFTVSWLTFRLVSRFWDSKRMFRSVAISAFSAYYIGVSPEIAEAWNWPSWTVAAILVLPATVLAWVIAKGSRYPEPSGHCGPSSVPSPKA